MGGGDTMRGLAGNDTYVVSNGNDVADESASGSGGIDTVLSSITSIFRWQPSERAISRTSYWPDQRTSMPLAITLPTSWSATAVTIRLDGQGGGDTMRGLAGNDTYVVSRRRRGG